MKLVTGPTRYSSESQLSTRPGGQDSLVHLLLQVESLQPHVMELLFDQMDAIMDEDDEHYLLLLAQMKGLDALVDGEVSCTLCLAYVCLLLSF